MRTSIMLNPAALQAELFAVYFQSRSFEVGGLGYFVIETSGNKDSLILNVYQKRELIAAFKISKESHPELRSTEISDYYRFFVRQFGSVIEYFERLKSQDINRPLWSSNEMMCIKQMYLDHYTNNESILHGEWFGMDKFPDRKNDSVDYTDDVLIDPNGNRERFLTGYYLFDSEDSHWCLYEKDYYKLIDEEHAKWTYLPLSKYDKQKSGSGVRHFVKGL